MNSLSIGKDPDEGCTTLMVKARLQKYADPIAVIRTDRNGCCDRNVFIVYRNWIHTEKRWNYFSVCACGGWCTTGCTSMKEAINEYEKMCDRLWRKPHA